jgi:hypothetical protein
MYPPIPGKREVLLGLTPLGEGIKGRVRVVYLDPVHEPVEAPFVGLESVPILSHFQFQIQFHSAHSFQSNIQFYTLILMQIIHLRVPLMTQFI